MVLHIRNIIFFSLVVGQSVFAITEDFSKVNQISRIIRHLQPKVNEAKSLQYALAIHKASEKYSIDPMVMIAITQQETSFREKLPEGKAGEIGICQIRKSWLSNNQFRSEFKKASIRDLYNPSKAFMFAAWILAGLKDRRVEEVLPYWSYYNSVKFHNRLKYYNLVNKKLNHIEKSGLMVVEANATPAKRKLVAVKETQPLIAESSVGLPSQILLRSLRD